MEEYASFNQPAEVLLETDLYEVFDGGVRCRGKNGGEPTIECDTVILTATLKDNVDYAYTAGRPFMSASPETAERRGKSGVRCRTPFTR